MFLNHGLLHIIFMNNLDQGDSQKFKNYVDYVNRFFGHYVVELA